MFDVPEELQCWIEFPHQWHWQLYMTLVAVTVFVIPALIITACYTVIVFTIWSKSKLLTPGAKRARHMKSRCCPLSYYPASVATNSVSPHNYDDKKLCGLKPRVFLIWNS